MDIEFTVIRIVLYAFPVKLDFMETHDSVDSMTEAYAQQAVIIAR